MRPIVNSTFVSLDGVINHMEKWHFDYIDDELDAIARDQLFAADAMLMGRQTYEAYAAVWPARSDEYADRINDMPKHVVSTTLATPEWNNTTVLGADWLGEVEHLKTQPGKAILMHGYGPLAKTLLRRGLLDELHLWVHPALAGVGQGNDLLLDPGLNVTLEFAGARPMKSGVVVLSYRAQTV
jgi:dihydrofolate reductase